MRILLDPMPGQGSSGSPYETGNMADEPGGFGFKPRASNTAIRTTRRWSDLKSAAAPTDDEAAETDDTADAAPAASSDNPAIANLD
jgi:hypothetical protein